MTGSRQLNEERWMGTEVFLCRVNTVWARKRCCASQNQDVFTLQSVGAWKQTSAEKNEGCKSEDREAKGGWVGIVADTCTDIIQGSRLILNNNIFLVQVLVLLKGEEGGLELSNCWSRLSSKSILTTSCRTSFPSVSATIVTSISTSSIYHILHMRQGQRINNVSSSKSTGIISKYQSTSTRTIWTIRKY